MEFTADSPVMQAFLAQIEREAPEMRAAWDALPIEWHCQGRHGVVRDVPAEKAGEVERVIEWFLGHGGCWWTKTVDGKRSVEFVHMTKVYPPPGKPWEWCGTTVLFGDWQTRLADTKALAAEFAPGDPVEFEFKGETKRGLVMYPNERTVSVMVEGEGRYTVPPEQLTSR